MRLRLITFSLIVAFSLVPAVGQNVAETGGKKVEPKPVARAGEKLYDFPFPNGVDLQFFIKHVARELGINVLFDADSFRGPRKTNIELKNVTARDALDYVLLQEKLFFEEAGPRTIIVAMRTKQLKSIPQLGADVMPVLTDQLANYFGVTSGILITSVRTDSPGLRAGLKAGDIIVEMDGHAIRYPYALFEAINETKAADIALTVVRDREHITIRATPERGADKGYLLKAPADAATPKPSE